MRRRSLLVGVPFLLYVVFWAWYTNLGGAIDDVERAALLARFEALGYPRDRLGRLDAFMRADDGRQFIMVNALDLADAPPVLPATGPDAPASALLGHYMAHMYPALLARACHPVFFGSSIFEAMDVAGIDGAERWDQAALMRYRSRRDMLHIASDPAFAERHDYKLAALEKTVAWPVAPMLYSGDLRVWAALVLVLWALLVEVVLAHAARRRLTSTR